MLVMDEIGAGGSVLGGRTGYGGAIGGAVMLGAVPIGFEQGVDE